MAFCNDIPSIVIPDFPGGQEWDSATELKGEPWTALDPVKVATAGLEPAPAIAPVADPPVGQTWADPQPYPQR